uniref:Pseudouridylate synthase 1 homolog n=1 Tax=Cacopsylla melanoneura TaxID=428564 RepID=A0A8D9ES90_9HEMI
MNKYFRLILGFFFLPPGGLVLLTDSLPKTFRRLTVASKVNKSHIEPIMTSTRMKRTRNTAEWNALDPEEKRLKAEERVKRRKMAMMFAYSGVGYLGLQRNKGTKTIEGDIMEALYKAGLVTEEIRETPQLIHFQRAARTDKGVSALKQIVSLKLPDAATKEGINEHLPDQIRILGLKRVTKGFNSKNSCDARTYSYTCPSYAFATPGDTREDYRMSEERWKYVEALLRQYQGTHNFHNFTSKRKPLDPSCSRYIMSFISEQPFVRDGLEMITLKVKGQSFMLHQIRKMVGVVMAIARGYVTEDIIGKTYTIEQYDLPIAPGLGLLLEQVHYDLYNERYGKDGMHETLHFHEIDDDVNAFREKFILPYIVKAEVMEKPMLEWLEHLSEHSWDTREVKKARAAELGQELPQENNSEDEDDTDDEGNGRKRNKPNHARSRNGGCNSDNKTLAKDNEKEHNTSSNTENVGEEKVAGISKNVEKTLEGKTDDANNKTAVNSHANNEPLADTPAATVEKTASPVDKENGDQTAKVGDDATCDVQEEVKQELVEQGNKT